MKTLSKFCTMCCVTVFTLFTAVSCGQKTDKNEQVSTCISNEVVLNLVDFQDQADSLIGKSINLRGNCKHICSHGGKKIFLVDTVNDINIKGMAGVTIDRFDVALLNKDVCITGEVVEERIDEDYLVQWEKEAMENTAEQHGNGEEGCATEKDNRGEVANTTLDRIADFRARIAERKDKEGKNYLSFYSIKVSDYKACE